MKTEMLKQNQKLARFAAPGNIIHIALVEGHG